MNFLSDIITYVRRIIKSPSDSVISDNLIIDYINRFWIMDVDARMQLFDLKTTYQFQTVPAVDRYNMPLYSIQIEQGSQDISFYPVYQGFMGPAYVNGIQVPFQTTRNDFFNIWPNIVQLAQVVGTGDGTVGPYNLNIGFLGNPPTPLNPPLTAILRGHVDMAGIISTGINQDPPLVSASSITAQETFIQDMPVTSVYPAVYFTAIGSDGSSIVVSDSGQFLEANQNYGLLMQPGKAPLGNLPLGDGVNPIAYSTTLNTINYLTGEAVVRFPTAIPAGAQIQAQVYFFQTGLPRSILFYNNVLTLRSPPDQQYLVELDAYLTPAAFLTSSQAIPFGYMAEYIARGAARKILADTGDVEQFNFYEPLFQEQEMLVWKRSQRQFTSTRTQTIYSIGTNIGQSGFNNIGGSTV